MTTIVKHYHTESINEWAVRTLNPTDLAAFNAAFAINQTRWEEYASQGRITIQPIMQDVLVPSLGQTVTVQIGEETAIAAGYSLSDVTTDPSLIPWLDRYTSETNPPPVTFK
jgi:hypothetical protein